MKPFSFITQIPGLLRCNTYSGSKHYTYDNREKIFYVVLTPKRTVRNCLKKFNNKTSRLQISANSMLVTEKVHYASDYRILCRLPEVKMIKYNQNVSRKYVN